MRLLPSAAALVLALTLTACGDDGDSSADDPKSPASSQDSSSASSEDPSSPSTSTATVDTSADQAIVDASVLTLDDMPAGWTSEAAEEDDADDQKAKEAIAACVGVEYTDLYRDENITAESETFTSPDEEEVSVEVGLAADEGWMMNAFRIGSTPQFRDCVVTSIKERFTTEEDVTVGDITTNAMSFNPIGDDVYAFRMTMELSTQGYEFETIADYVVIRVGRGQVLLTTFVLGDPLSVDDLDRYAQICVDRLTAGLAAP